GVVPAAAGLKRDQLLYRAGQASVRSAGWFWPGTAGALGIAATALGTLLWFQPAPQRVRETCYVRVEVPAATEVVHASAWAPGLNSTHVTVDDSGPVPAPYYKLQEQLLRWGLDALPSPPPDRVVAPPPKPDARLASPDVPDWLWFGRLFKLGEPL